VVTKVVSNKDRGQSAARFPPDEMVPPLTGNDIPQDDETMSIAASQIAVFSS
jgi:hypothetical protein